MAGNPIQRKRLSDVAADKILEMIKEKNLKPGDKLPSERKLMNEFEVGRSAIREALRILENRGIVNVKQGKGTFITDPGEKTFEPLKHWITYQDETLHEHFEVRLLIEPDAAYIAAERAEEKIIRKLEETHRQYVNKLQEDDFEKKEIIKLDAKFHFLIAQATKNKTLSILMETFYKSLLEGWKATLNIEGRPEKTVSEHDKILSAIKNSSPQEASNYMKKHLEVAIKDLDQNLREGEKNEH